MARAKLKLTATAARGEWRALDMRPAHHTHDRLANGVPRGQPGDLHSAHHTET